MTPALADPVRLAARFGRQLAREEARLEPVSFEEIEAYVDGTGDESSRALFAERMERDPALVASVADLAALRVALEGEIPDASPRRIPSDPARLVPFRRSANRRRLGWAAAAAAALTAAVLVGPSVSRRGGAPEIAAEPAPAAAAVQQVFADGFEAGSSEGWTAVSSGG
jgi:anti-sigma factor RsiW